jgi:hypothetical protein
VSQNLTAFDFERRKTMKMKEVQQVTKAICNKGFSGNSIILPRIKIRVGGQESSPQSLTAYSLDRQTAQKPPFTNNIIIL